MMLENYEKLIGKHASEKACILGAGTSIKDLDVARLQNHVIISVNSSIIMLDWEQGSDGKRYWLSNDALVRHWSYYEKIKRSVATKLVRDSWHKYFDEIPDFLQFSTRPENYEEIDPNQKLLTGISSIPTAIDLAIQMGCSEIYIYGLDQYPYMNKYHFYDFLPQAQQPVFALGRLPPNVITYCYQNNQRIFPILNNFAHSRSCKIYNCNPISKVQCFEMLDHATSYRYLNV